MKVRVYKNLHNGRWSVKSMERDFHYNRVIAHTNRIMGNDVQFIVNEGGRQRVICEGQKNVHAFVQMNAFLVDLSTIWFRDSRGCIPLESEFLTFREAFRHSKGRDAALNPVKYNPYKQDYFSVKWIQYAIPEPIYNADLVYFLNGECCVVTERI